MIQKYEVYSPKTDTTVALGYFDKTLTSVDFGEKEVNLEFWQYVLNYWFEEAKMKVAVKRLDYTLNKIVDLPPTFEVFWETYNYKFDRKRAEDQWKKLKPNDKQAAYDHIKAYKNELIRSGVAQMYAKTYLHNEVWK